MALPAQAILLVIDDFSIPQAKVRDTTIGDGGVSVTIPIRTLTHELLVTPFPLIAPPGGFPYDPTAYTQVIQPGGGLLTVLNGAGENSNVSATWQIGPDFVPLNILAQFEFLVKQTDSNPTNVDFYFGTTLAAQSLLTHQVILPNLADTNIYFDLTDAQVAKINKGGFMTMKMSGIAGWDMNIDTYGINYVPAPVSEAGSLGLMGLGLTGLGLLRRRKTANSHLNHLLAI
jgi:hypothetical protein